MASFQPSRTYFHFYKKGFLNSQAVRIRVKVFFYNKPKFNMSLLLTGSGSRLNSNETIKKMTKSCYAKIDQTCGLDSGHVHNQMRQQ
jgi:hypothetical protein